jgi:hypothetical protein
MRPTSPGVRPTPLHFGGFGMGASAGRTGMAGRGAGFGGMGGMGHRFGR